MYLVFYMVGGLFAVLRSLNRLGVPLWTDSYGLSSDDLRAGHDNR